MNCPEPFFRYRIELAYHGAGFHGWQRQPGLRTVQGELERWLERLLPFPGPVTVTGAGRTDAGVHAEGMVAHFDTPSPLDHAALARRLQAALPHDLLLRGLMPVDRLFHARYSASSKVYKYRFRCQRSPFERDRVWERSGPFDIGRAQVAAQTVFGRHDFSGFCRAVSRKPNMACNVFESCWRAVGDEFIYCVRADRFLHTMVRLLVGTMVDTARGRWSHNRMEEILAERDVRLCGAAAPPHGLTLVTVSYPPSGVPGDELG